MGRSDTTNIILIGLSHKTAPIAVREQYAFTPEDIPAFLGRLISESETGITEGVLLSTCNRTELYLAGVDTPDAIISRVMAYLRERTPGMDGCRDCFYTLHSTAVIEHLFKVVSGIDSMVLGEPQIFGQVKSAYSISCDYDFTGPLTNRLFHHAFQVGKRVRSDTSIGEGIVSVSSAAVALAEKTLDGLAGAKTMLIGAGKIGELCAKQLIGCGVDDFFLMNRTQERADELTCRLSGTAVPFDRLPAMLAEADIIITSVTRTEPVISAEAVTAALNHRGGRPLVLIDLGVPRNIDPAVAGIAGMHLFNIDNLEEVTLDTRDRREEEAGKALEIIEAEVAGYESWLKERETVPVIQDLRTSCERIRTAELSRIRNRIDDDTFRTIDLVTRRIVRKILHNPTVAVRSSATGEARDMLLDSIRELFIRKSGE